MIGTRKRYPVDSAVLAVASGMTKVIAGLEGGPDKQRQSIERDLGFDQVIAEAVTLLEKAREGCVYRSTLILPSGDLREYISAYEAVGPPLSEAGVPGAVENRQITWLIDQLNAMKKGVALPKADRDKVAFFFRWFAEEASG